MYMENSVAFLSRVQERGGQSSRLQDSAIKREPLCGPEPATGYHPASPTPEQSALLKSGQSKSVFEECKIHVHGHV